jgi:hypothetical protein
MKDRVLPEGEHQIEVLHNWFRPISSKYSYYGLLCYNIAIIIVDLQSFHVPLLIFIPKKGMTARSPTGKWKSCYGFQTHILVVENEFLPARDL